MNYRSCLGIFVAAIAFASVAHAAAPSAPVCGATGTRSEGWYGAEPAADGNSSLIKYANCAGCTAECRAIGSRSEGWYDSCDDSLIRWDNCAQVFSDVEKSHPNYDAILYVQSRNIVSGYPDGTFRPDARINRAEFTKIVTLYKFGQEMIDQCGTHMQFSDVSFDAWYGKYVCRAKDAHLIDGYPDGSFRPDRSINFAEAAKIIARTDTFNAGDPTLPQDAGGPWYEVYVQYLRERSAVPSSVSRMDQLITRGEMAEIIYRLRRG